MDADDREMPDLELSKAACDRLRELMHHPNGSIALAACTEILDRVFGPPGEAPLDDDDAPNGENMENEKPQRPIHGVTKHAPIKPAIAGVTVVGGPDVVHSENCTVEACAVCRDKQEEG